MTQHSTTDTQADRAAETKTRILEAALREFSENGLAGARTEQIAAAAGVNKALLYYYFESKDKLYAAALELRRFARSRSLDGRLPPRGQSGGASASRGARPL